jgi:hypothetical protein
LAHRLFELNAAGYSLSADEMRALSELSDQQVARLDRLREESGNTMSCEDWHWLAARRFVEIATSTITADSERGLRLVQEAAGHADKIIDFQRRREIRASILRCLANGERNLWGKAVAASLDYENALFDTFESLALGLLTSADNDGSTALRLRAIIDWAENMWFCDREMRIQGSELAR